MHRTIILLLSLFFIASCATPNVDHSYQPQEASGKGVLVGSITRSKGSPSEYEVLYRQLPSGKSGYIAFGEGRFFIPVSGNLDSFGARGNAFAVELPAGTYAIYSWRVKSGYATIDATQSFSAKFDIQPGKLVYVGNFDFTETDKMGLTVTGVSVAWRDMRDRDLAAFKQSYPAMALLPVGAAIEPGANMADLGGSGNTTVVIPIIVPVY